MIKSGTYSLDDHGVSVTTLKTWMTCREATRLRLSGLKPRFVSFPLTFGDVVHQVHQLAHRALKEKRIKGTPSKKDLQGWIAQVERQWRERNPKATAITLEDFELSLLFSEAVLPIYFEYWEESLRAWKWIDVEDFFRLPIELANGKVIPFVGKKDATFETGKSKGLWVLETKTKGRVQEEAIVDSLSMDLQTNGYLYATWKLGKRIPHGSVRNIIRRPGLRKGKKESMAAFAKRCAADVEDRPDYYFMRFELQVTREDLETFEQEFKGLLLEFWRWYYEIDRHYRNTSACESGFGRQCDFLAFCARGDMSRLAQRGGRNG